MDLILLIFLVDWIGRRARKSGMNVFRWRLRFFLYCLGADLFFASVSLMFSKQLPIALVSGFLGAVLVGLMVFQWFRKEEEDAINSSKS